MKRSEFLWVLRWVKYCMLAQCQTQVCVSTPSMYSSSSVVLGCAATRSLITSGDNGSLWFVPGFRNGNSQSLYIIQEGFTKITPACSGHPSAPWKVSQSWSWLCTNLQYSSRRLSQVIQQLFILVSEPSWVKKCKNFTFLVITEPFFDLQWSVIPPMNDLSLRSNFPYRFFFKEIKNFAFFS